MAFGLAGRPDSATRLLTATLGDLSETEVQTRLVTGGHSLMSKGLVTVDEGKVELSQSFAELIGRITGHEFSIVYIKSGSLPEESLTYYIQSGLVVRQRSCQGVTYSLSQPDGTHEVISDGFEFFEIPSGRETDTQTPPVAVPVVQRAREAATQDIGASMKALVQGGVPLPLASQLVEDMHASRYRGVVMRSRTAAGVLTPQEALLVLAGPARQWLLVHVQGDAEGLLQILPSTQDAFRRQMEHLLVGEGQQP